MRFKDHLNQVSGEAQQSGVLAAVLHEGMHLLETNTCASVDTVFKLQYLPQWVRNTLFHPSILHLSYTTAISQKE